MTTSKDRKVRNAVLERDQWCVYCGNPDKLTPHHIVPRMWAPTRFKMDNIITLCMECHDKVHRDPDYKALVYASQLIDEKERFKEAGYW